MMPEQNEAAVLWNYLPNVSKLVNISTIRAKHILISGAMMRGLPSNPPIKSDC